MTFQKVLSGLAHSEIQRTILKRQSMELEFRLTQNMAMVIVQRLVEILSPHAHLFRVAMELPNPTAHLFRLG